MPETAPFRETAIRAAICLGLLTCASVWGEKARADVFAYTDADGTTHYTNEPTDAKFRLVVEALKMPAVKKTLTVPNLDVKAAAYASVIEQVADDVGVDSALVHAVIVAESGYNPKATSRAGAQGIMQLMPATAKRYGVKDSLDPGQNIRGGVRYLKDLLDMFDNDLELAVAAYNSGENAVIRHGMKIPPYKETRAYVPKVLSLYGAFRGRI
jgi:soluble lytic murein transglycosylase-like protein